MGLLTDARFNIITKMKINLPKISGALLPLFLAAFNPLQAAEPTKPNILVIYTDDHGWADLGAQGVDKDIRTPNIDKLAQDGIRFFRGYVSAPQCVPSRAGVITGRYQEKFGVEDNTKGPLPLDEMTIPKRLKAAGYVSGQVGKWHLAGEGTEDAVSQKGHLPPNVGFDEYFCGTMRQFWASHDLAGHPFADAPHSVSDTRFRIIVQTEAALSFLDRRAAKLEQPWFLYLAFFAPHVPLESPEPWFSKTPTNLPIERRQALSMIAAMDDGVGRIRAKLRAMGVETNTLIFCISDNGAPLHPGAWNGSLNLPLIGEKGMLTDGGVRTPFIAAWPGTLPAGKVYDWPVINLDVASTAVALAGLPHDDKLDGVNLIPFLTGEKLTAPHDYLYWRWRSQSSVLEYPWKLIHVGKNESYLFDVTKPEGELKNVMADHAEIVARLDAKLKTWCASLKPPGPAIPDNKADNEFYAAHVDKTIDSSLYGKHVETAKNGAAKRGAGTGAADAIGGVQGWLYRNGTLAVKDGALALTPKNAAAFLTHPGLNVSGPVTVVMRVRAKQGGASSLTWRTKTTADFNPKNTATFDWPTSSEWKEVKTELPVSDSLVHLRINPGKDCAGVEIQSIELRGKDAKPQIWHFGALD
jgi:uncharacterized sulfatase